MLCHPFRALNVELYVSHASRVNEVCGDWRRSNLNAETWACPSNDACAAVASRVVLLAIWPQLRAPILPFLLASLRRV